MWDFKAKMYQIVCQLRLRPDPAYIVYIVKVSCMAQSSTSNVKNHNIVLTHFIVSFYFFTCLIFVSPRSGWGPQKLATAPNNQQKIIPPWCTWWGADHPTTKPVQNAFYTKIIHFFHLFKIFGEPGPPWAPWARRHCSAVLSQYHIHFHTTIHQTCHWQSCNAPNSPPKLFVPLRRSPPKCNTLSRGVLFPLNF